MDSRSSLRLPFDSPSNTRRYSTSLPQTTVEIAGGEFRSGIITLRALVRSLFSELHGSYTRNSLLDYIVRSLVKCMPMPLACPGDRSRTKGAVGHALSRRVHPFFTAVRARPQGCLDVCRAFPHSTQTPRNTPNPLRRRCPRLRWRTGRLSLRGTGRR